MAEQIFRTLHADAQPGDLFTLEQRLQQLNARIAQLEQTSAALAARVQELEAINQQLILKFQSPPVLPIPASSPAQPSHVQPQEPPSPPLLPRQDALPVLASFERNRAVFGNYNLKRNEIVSITFLDTLADTPDSAWDVSLQKDCSVLAWVKGVRGAYALFIAGEGGVRSCPDCSNLFAGFTEVRQISFNRNFDTSQATDMRHMFSLCSKLTDLDLSGFDTSNVTNMTGMFFDCSSLTALDVSGFDTSNVTGMYGMFYICSSLTALDLSGFDTSNVTDMGWMFCQCSNLKTLKLSNFDLSHVKNTSEMFSQCRSLSPETVRQLKSKGIPA